MGKWALSSPGLNLQWDPRTTGPVITWLLDIPVPYLWAHQGQLTRRSQCFLNPSAQCSSLSKRQCEQCRCRGGSWVEVGQSVYIVSAYPTAGNAGNSALCSPKPGLHCLRDFSLRALFIMGVGLCLAVSSRPLQPVCPHQSHSHYAKQVRTSPAAIPKPILTQNRNKAILVIRTHPPEKAGRVWNNFISPVVPLVKEVW